MTHLGRFTTAIMCVWGNFILALIVISFSNMLTMSRADRIVYNKFKYPFETIGGVRLNKNHTEIS
jgi:hypothetical protein